MTAVLGCDIPEDLYYLVEKHVWGRLEGDVLVVGLTDVAQNLAKGIISVTTKRVGRSLAKGKSIGTVESSKWVGPVPAPVGGEIVEVNDALTSEPALVNRDPYGQGWIAKLKPDNWEAEASDLVTGEEGVAAYRRFLESQGISCEDG
ncbi:MAG TPA: glycine cleavage system protein GcvH [Solirubrobacteraceae bacterium]|nr:glycine cleavage system protein GcvH [Solirubrobacteraceae bacterium]